MGCSHSGSRHSTIMGSAVPVPGIVVFRAQAPACPKTSQNQIFGSLLLRKCILGSHPTLPSFSDDGSTAHLVRDPLCALLSRPPNSAPIPPSQFGSHPALPSLEMMGALCAWRVIHCAHRALIPLCYQYPIWLSSRPAFIWQ